MAKRASSILSRWVPLAVVALVALGGCAAVPRDILRSEDEIADLAALRRAAARRQVTTSRRPTRIGQGIEVRVALHETGEPSAGRTVVLIHGALSDHESWRFVSGALGADHGLILVDLPGCGESDRPEPEALGSDGYGPDALAARVCQALDRQLAGRRPRPRITLVGHSLGGTVAIRMMASPDVRSRYDRLLRRVDRLVLFAPVDVELCNPHPMLKRLPEVTAAQIRIADLSGHLTKRVYQTTANSFDDPTRALLEEADKRLAMLRQPDTRRAAQAMFSQMVAMRSDRPDWPAIERLVADYANVDVPCLIVWGARDETLPVAMGYKLAAQLPRADLHVIGHAMHSLPLEHPGLCADLIRNFTATGSHEVTKSLSHEVGAPAPAG